MLKPTRKSSSRTLSPLSHLTGKTRCRGSATAIGGGTCADVQQAERGRVHYEHPPGDVRGRLSRSQPGRAVLRRARDLLFLLPVTRPQPHAACVHRTMYTGCFRTNGFSTIFFVKPESESRPRKSFAKPQRRSRDGAAPFEKINARAFVSPAAGGIISEKMAETQSGFTGGKHLTFF